MAEEKESILRIVVDSNEAKKRLAENIAALEKNAAELKELRKQLTENRKAYEAGELSVEAYTQASQKTAESIALLSNEQKALQKESRQLANVLAAPIGSLNEQRAVLSQLLSAYDSFVVGVSGTEEEFKALEAEIQRVTKAVKGQEEATGRAQRNVGNYEEAIKNAINANSGLAGSIGNITGVLDTVKATIAAYNTVVADSTAAISSFTTSLREADLSAKGLTAAFTRLTKTTLTLNNAFKVLRAGLIALPLFAIIAALTSLVAFFGSTQKGADLLSRAIAPLRVGFDKLLGILQNLGEELFEKIQKAFTETEASIENIGDAIAQKLIDRFSMLLKLGPAITKFFSGDFKGAAKDATDAIVGFVTGVEDFTDKATEGVKKFIDETVKDGAKVVDLQIAIEKSEIALIKRRAAANKIIKEQQLIADDVTKSEQERIEATNKAEMAIEDLRKQELALFDLRQKQLELEQSFNDTNREGEKQAAELAAQRAELEAGLTDRLREQVTKRVGIQAQFSATLRELSLQDLKDQESDLQKQLSNERLSFEDRGSLVAELGQTLVNIEQKTLEEIAEDRSVSEAQREVKLREANRRIIEIEAQTAAELLLLEQNKVQKSLSFISQVSEIEAQQAQADFDLAASFGVASIEQATALTDLKLEALNNRYALEQEAAKGNAEQLEIIERQFAAQETAILREEANRREQIRKAELDQQQKSVQAVSGLVSALGGLFGEQTAAAKVAAQANATLAYIQELQNIQASATSPLFPGNPPTAGLAGAGIAATQTIAATIRYGTNLASISQAGAGGEFMTTKPTLLLVGDNPSGRERVSVSPIGSSGSTRIAPNSGLIDMSGRNEGNFISTMSAAKVAAQSAQSAQTPVLVLETLQKAQRRVSMAESLAKF
jgi:hypothetical protein